MNALLLAVVEELGTRICELLFKVQKHSTAYEGLLGCNSTWLTAGVVLKRESANSFSRFLMAKFETPMLLTRPDSGSF